MYSASARGSVFGIVVPCSRARSISVCGRTDPARWQCSAALGNRRRISRSIGVALLFGRGGTAIALRDDAENGARLQRAASVDGKAAAVGQDLLAVAHGSCDGRVELFDGVDGRRVGRNVDAARVDERAQG